MGKNTNDTSVTTSETVISERKLKKLINQINSATSPEALGTIYSNNSLDFSGMGLNKSQSAQIVNALRNNKQLIQIINHINFANNNIGYPGMQALVGLMRSAEEKNQTINFNLENNYLSENDRVTLKNLYDFPQNEKEIALLSQLSSTKIKNEISNPLLMSGVVTAEVKENEIVLPPVVEETSVQEIKLEKAEKTVVDSKAVKVTEQPLVVPVIVEPGIATAITKEKVETHEGLIAEQMAQVADEYIEEMQGKSSYRKENNQPLAEKIQKGEVIAQVAHLEEVAPTQYFESSAEIKQAVEMGHALQAAQVAEEASVEEMQKAPHRHVEGYRPLRTTLERSIASREYAGVAKTAIEMTAETVEVHPVAEEVVQPEVVAQMAEVNNESVLVEEIPTVVTEDKKYDIQNYAFSKKANMDALNDGVILIDEQEIHDDEMTSLCDFLRINHRSYTMLVITGCYLTDYYAGLLASALEVNVTMTSVYLNRNMISDLGAFYIATAMTFNHTITEFDLRDNPIGYAGISAIQEVSMYNISVTFAYSAVTEEYTEAQLNAIVNAHEGPAYTAPVAEEYTAEQLEAIVHEAERNYKPQYSVVNDTFDKNAIEDGGDLGPVSERLIHEKDAIDKRIEQLMKQVEHAIKFNQASRHIFSPLVKIYIDSKIDQYNALIEIQQSRQAGNNITQVVEQLLTNDYRSALKPGFFKHRKPTTEAVKEVTEKEKNQEQSTYYKTSGK